MFVEHVWLYTIQEQHKAPRPDVGHGASWFGLVDQHLVRLLHLHQNKVMTFLLQSKERRSVSCTSSAARVYIFPDFIFLLAQVQPSLYSTCREHPSLPQILFPCCRTSTLVFTVFILYCWWWDWSSFFWSWQQSVTAASRCSLSCRHQQPRHVQGQVEVFSVSAQGKDAGLWLLSVWPRVWPRVWPQVWWSTVESSCFIWQSLSLCDIFSATEPFQPALW